MLLCARKCQNLKVSEFESVRIGKCQNLKVSDSAGVGILKVSGFWRCRNRKMSESESVRIRNCQNFKELESVRIRKCQNVKKLESVIISKCRISIFNCQDYFPFRKSETFQLFIFSTFWHFPKFWYFPTFWHFPTFRHFRPPFVSGYGREEDGLTFFISDGINITSRRNQCNDCNIWGNSIKIEICYTS